MSERKDTKSEKNLALDRLLKQQPSLWRGRDQRDQRHVSQDTGYQKLNQLLPTGGWPLGAVTEILVDQWGNGEMQILLPLIVKLSQDSPVVFIAPPHHPYAPALEQAGINLSRLLIIDNQISSEDTWWCAEKILKHPECRATFVWTERLHHHRIRRLQLAASTSNTLGFLLRSGRPVDTPIPLRIKVSRRVNELHIRLLKSRFGWQQNASTTLSHTDTWNRDQ